MINLMEILLTLDSTYCVNLNSDEKVLTTDNDNLSEYLPVNYSVKTFS